MSIGLEDIRRAAAIVAEDLPPTPTVAAPRLSEQTGTKLFLKLESLRHTGSFKERGALVKLRSLDAAQARQGVIAMSAGNHAQGVAHHATRLGIPATIVMPAQTPFTKVERTEAYGGRVLLHGDTLSDAETFAHAVAEHDGLTFVHPYDDPLIIAGQGTIGLEMLEAVPDLDTLVIPIGGGGLIAGIAVAAKALKPGIRIIGVEAELYPSMKRTLADAPVSCSGATIAEGIAVKSPGLLTREIIRDLVDDIVLVGEECLERAIYTLITEQKLVVEGAGAAGVAALLDDPDRFAGQTVGTVICGGNIDARVLASILMRGLVRQRRVVRLRIGLSDAPGALAKVAQFLGDAGGNIVEVYHQRLFHNVPVKMADIDVVLETRDPAHVDAIIAQLRAAGYPAELMDDVS
ncbi:threonine dehydratase [Skermanella stibiiresistens SB22]|uniref:Threonine dehydratase n=1 Tax=Skermanella stibiiresistens SB22 TaxID=1385369 RepID=W9H259_9PROT|nr:threonine ammonia-lyase [Skermanella stibiiresistens]EWY38906.1 threonine dehydratase [Skermanella stibiiresistens SB22]